MAIQCTNKCKSSSTDMISNPPHYTKGRELEPIDAVIDWEIERGKTMNKFYTIDSAYKWENLTTTCPHCNTKATLDVESYGTVGFFPIFKNQEDCERFTTLTTQPDLKCKELILKDLSE